ADDFQPRVLLAAQTQPLAEWVLIRPVTARHRLVDDEHARRVLVVALGEGAALDNRRIHRLEVIVADDAVKDIEALVLCLRDAAFDGDARAVILLVERERPG